MAQLRVLINGSTGRMGQLALSTLKADPTFQIVATPTRDEDLGMSIRESRPQVILDFTVSQVVYQNAITIIESGCRPVIGTTGLTPDEVKTLQAMCERKGQGGLIAPNFSMGIAVLVKLSEQAARHFGHAEIIEAHHDKKLDAPSGTALYTAKCLAEVRENAPLAATSTEIVEGARGANVESIPIHAVRLPGYAAYQQVIFGAPGETLQLTHQTTSGDCYRQGIVFACKKVMSLDRLVYGLDQILDW